MVMEMLTVYHLSVIFLVSTSCICYAIPVDATSTSAFFIFGDSSVDPGNNNYINTIAENRADYKPYGQNGYFDGPNGRFSDGRVIVDFIAEYAKLPLIPPYLQPSSDFTLGANFASGGAGVLSETNEGTVIDLQTQLKYFDEVQKSLAEKLGDERTQELISGAVYLFSIGSNDYMGGFLGSPKMQELYSTKEFVNRVISNMIGAIYGLYQKGGRKFAILSLGPLGCYPTFRALNANIKEGECFEQASALAKAHNDALSVILEGLADYFKGFKYSKASFYDWLLRRLENPSKYGFKDGVNACCGSGPYGGIDTCGGTKVMKDYELCSNPADYVFWDSFHPTERIHQHFAQESWNGSRCWVGPYTLEDLFFNQDEKQLTIEDTLDVPQKPLYLDVPWNNFIISLNGNG